MLLSQTAVFSKTDIEWGCFYASIGLEDCENVDGAGQVGNSIGKGAREGGCLHTGMSKDGHELDQRDGLVAMHIAFI